MLFMGFLFCGICELHVMQPSICFHILPPLAVKIIPVFHFTLSAVSDNLLVILLFYLSISVVFLLYGKMFEGELNCHF